jgi:hypothetical protein
MLHKLLYFIEKAGADDKRLLPWPEARQEA